MKVTILLITFLILTSVLFAQEKQSSKRVVEYPNELKGLELMKISKLKSLILSIRTSRDKAKINQALPENCAGICKIDDNWEVVLKEYEPNGENVLGILFQPLKRVSLSKVKFPKQFQKFEMQIIDQLKTKATRFLGYRDKYGLKYVIVNDDADPNYKIGDLFYIEYGLSDEELKWQQNRFQ